MMYRIVKKKRPFGSPAMQYNQPKQVHARIRDLVKQSIARVSELPEAESTHHDLGAQRDAALSVLEQYRDRVTASLDALEQVAEWEVFTIAMYGETNAGKSTVIETLRILFGEPDKRQSQAEFRRLRDAHAIDGERVQALERELQGWVEQRASHEHALQKLKAEHEGAGARMAQEKEALRDALRAAESRLSRWGRLLRRFRPLKEEVALAEHAALLERAEQARASALKMAAAGAAGPAGEVRRCEAELQAAREALAQMAPHQDGAIIGNGRSDFTLEQQTYRLELDGSKVDLLDVPGIEGDEEKVRDAIGAAVRKCHAVFYVTRRAGPPNQGEDGRPGTLEKIRQHLGSQTEVWAVYNKGVTNPAALPATGLLNEGEITSLPDLERELRAQLGDAYQRCVSLAALPAFYAAADCLLPGSSHERNRRKFLAAMDQRSLLEKSGFAGFVHTLRNELCRDHKPRIQRSNLRKIRVLLEEGSAMLAGVIDNFSAARKNLDTQWRSVCRELDTLEGRVGSAMRSRCGERLDACRAKTATEIHDRIGQGIDNDEFKQMLTGRVETLQAQLVADLQQALKEAMDEFEADVHKIVQRFHKKADAILEFNIESRLRDGVDDLALDFRMNNGIDTPRLLSALGGAGALALAVFFGSNPVGWVAAAVGAVGIFIGVVKSLIGFVSSSYRKEQQRKSADENLSRLFGHLDERVREHTAEAIVEVGRHLQEAKEQLGAPLVMVRRNLDALRAVRRDMQHLARQMTPKETETA